MCTKHITGGGITYRRNNHPPLAAKNGANTSDSTAINLIKILSDGPDVSFKGSPTVSPITAALWASDPFGPKVLACSDRPACNQETQIVFSFPSWKLTAIVCCIVPDIVKTNDQSP